MQGATAQGLGCYRREQDEFLRDLLVRTSGSFHHEATSTTKPTWSSPPSKFLALRQRRSESRKILSRLAGTKWGFFASTANRRSSAVRAFTGAVASAQVNGFCVHSLRATAATNALSHEADIAKVQEWLGHANVSTTRLTSSLISAGGDARSRKQITLAARLPGSSRADLAPPHTRLPARAIQSPLLLSAMARRSGFAHSSEHNSDLNFSDGDGRTRDIVTICDVTVHASVTNSLT